MAKFLFAWPKNTSKTYVQDWAVCHCQQAKVEHAVRPVPVPLLHVSLAGVGTSRIHRRSVPPIIWHCLRGYAKFMNKTGSWFEGLTRSIHNV